MKVAVLLSSVSRNGGGVYEAARRMVREQAAVGAHSLRVYGLEDSATARDLSTWEHVPVTTRTVVGPSSFGFAPGLAERLIDDGAELLHQHGLWMYPSMACRRWARRTAQPYVVTPHGMLDPWALDNAHWKKRIAAFIYEDDNLRNAACLHALCDGEAHAIRSYGLRNPVCIIPNGVDLPPSRELGVPAWESDRTESAKILLYLGRLHPKKNLLSLVHAWSELQRHEESSKRWRLVIAGWPQGDHAEDLSQAIRQLEVDDTVTLVGPQFGTDKHVTLSRANAFVLPSLSEGLPVAVLEAWSYGLPVVMTSHCNLPAGFRENAAIACDTSAASIACGLRRLFRASDGERAEMGERGRRLVETQHSWPRIGEMMAEVYRWVVGSGSKPSCVLAN